MHGQIAEHRWVLAVGAVFGFVGAFAAGANMLAIVWGPAIGAKAVSYRTAVMFGLVCQLLGLLAYGSQTVATYWGTLDDYTSLQPRPDLAAYSLMWTCVCVTIWQALAIWKRVLVPADLGNAASIIGAAFIYPGLKVISSEGVTQPSTSFLIGVLLTWCIAPMLSLTLGAAVFLVVRTWIIRGEDPFHKVIWDDDTVRHLALKATPMASWSQKVHAWLFDRDVFALVTSNDALMRIHRTAEEFEPAAEGCFIPFQVITCMFLSIAYGASNARTSVGACAMMYSIYVSGNVSQFASIPLQLRCIGAVGMGLGTLFCGFRLVPVTA
ncbi:Na+/Pi symporter [Trebouxia sp. C0009 RCD-2024]